MDFFPTNFMLQPPHEDDDHHHQSNHHHHHQILTSWIPQDQCHGLGQTLLEKRSPPMTFPGFEACGQLESPNGMIDHEADLSEDDRSSSHSLGEKKKIRLNMEQVKALEKSFESGNKLDPKRKLQLARALGLQPRQVAIWFQNRRARWKTKQLEKDYDLLKRQFDSVKADNDALQAKNKKLQEEIMALKGVRDTATTQYESINLNKDTEGCGSSRSSRENSSDILRLNVSSRPPQTEQDHENINHHNQSPVSRQLFPPTTGFGNIFGGITSDHHSGLWPWFDQQQQPQQQHLS